MKSSKITLIATTFLAASAAMAAQNSPVTVYGSSFATTQMAQQRNASVAVADQAQQAQKNMFTQVKSRITHERASEMLKMAQEAYNDDVQGVQEAFEGYAVVPFEASSGLNEGVFSRFGYVASKLDESGKLMINIMIRGTVSKNDAVTDGKVALVDVDPRLIGGVGSSAKVHTGFQQSTLSALEGLSEILMGLQEQYGSDAYATATLTVAGHSLGGAMATLIGMALAHNSYFAPNGVKQVVTFGAPAVGDKGLVRLVDSQLKNQTHYAQTLDPVGQLRAHNGYADLSGRLSLASQNAFYEGGCATHGLDGYKKSLDVTYGKTEYDGGWTGAAMEVLAPIAIPVANSTINAVSEICTDPVKAMSMLAAIGAFWNQLFA
jgi:hypothetical protein